MWHFHELVIEPRFSYHFLELTPQVRVPQATSAGSKWMWPMDRTYALIGVPSSAGAHWPGDEKAPTCLRDHGLVASFESAGLVVHDYGDLPVVRFRPDGVHRNRKSLSSVVSVARCVADEIADIILRNETLLVIGGDCSITVGVVAGLLRHADVCLLYFDGHADLNTPQTTGSGIFDGMGLAHMIGEPGTADELARIGSRYPLMPVENVVLFGCNPDEITDGEQAVIDRLDPVRFMLGDVTERGADAASEALAHLEKCAPRFLVHFDVDVIDFADLQVADVPQSDGGLTFHTAMDCLAVFARSPSFAGLVITEFNPDHLDANGESAAVFADGLARAQRTDDHRSGDQAVE